MSFKQWNAVFMLASAVLVGGWVIYDALLAEMPHGPASAVATRLLWAGLVMIGLNIGAAIGTAIVGGIVTRKQFKDEAADERDRAVYSSSMRNAYFVASLGGLAALFLIAFGYDASAVAYSVFIGGTLAGAAGAISQLYYYWVS